MSTDAPRHDSADELVRSLIAECQAARREGRTPDIDRLCQQHPELADDVVTARMSPPDPENTLAETTKSFDPGALASASTLEQSEPRIASGPPPKEFADFILVEEIARGGMGVVYRAQHKSLRRTVALKMILAGQFASAEQVRRFRNEAEQASNLEHPNIVPIYQVGNEQGYHYYTMRLIEGGNLNAHLRHFQQDVCGAAALVAQVARAVHFAHQRGILHRDLKPGNILLDAEGRPHVTDFGLAKHLGAAGAETQSGAVVGTPGFIAPEQAASCKDLTTACDVYGLGAVLYALLVGKPPFQAQSTLDVLQKVLEEDPIPPRAENSRVPRDLETICLACLAKDPRRRYASAEALAKDLERFLAGEAIRARRVGPVERLSKWARRRPAVAALLASSLLGLLAVAWVSSWNNVRLQAALQMARTQQTLAEATAAEANNQRQLVSQEFEKRREVVDDILIGIDDRLSRQANVPAGLRLEFLQDFLRVSQRILQDHPQDPVARRQVARIFRAIGDLYVDSDFDEAQRAYDTAVDMESQLSRAFPDRPQYRGDEALTRAHRAALLKRAAKPSAEEFRRAIALQDELAAAAPDHPEHAARAARFRFRLADALEDGGKPGEAEGLYREALAQQQRLSEASPGNPSVASDLASTLGSLAVLLEPVKPAESIRLLQESVAAERRAYRGNPRRHRQDLLEAYRSLAESLKNQGRHAELPVMAADFRRDFANDATQTYNAACYTANALDALRTARGVADSQRRQLADGYGQQAVALLQKAIKEGFTDAIHMTVDSDLDPLRERPDFRRTAAELAKSLPPVDPSKELAALKADYQNDTALFDRLTASAQTAAEKKRARQHKPDFAHFANRFLKFADAHRQSPAAVEALVWVLQTGDGLKESSAELVSLREQALQVLRRDHLHKADVALVCERLAENPVPEADELLRAALEQHAHEDVAGLAAYAFALALAEKAERARLKKPSDADRWQKEAEEQLEHARRFSTAPYGQSTLGEVAEAKLHALRHLSIGSQAQEIAGEDLDGKALRLSAFRGRVVVLDFWANWCGWCRQMYPQERQLAKRLRGKPFAMLGINGDDDREQTRKVVQKQRLDWPSWWDGGTTGERIQREWQVTAYPGVYVLDHRGVIRFKDVRGAELDAAVDQLLKERDAAARAGK